MGISKTHRQKALWIGILMVALLVTGCAGIEPYEPYDHREEGPKRGLLSGSEGEFVIYRKAEEPETGSGTAKTSEVTINGEQRAMDSEVKKAKSKSNDQQP